MSNLREYEALERKRRLKNKQRIVPASKPPLGPEIDYRNELLSFTYALNEEVERNIFPLLTKYEPQYVQDTPRQDILAQVDVIKKLFAPIEEYAKKTSLTFVGSVSAANKKRLEQSFKKSFGFSVPTLLREERIQKPINRHIDENVRLIKTIAPEHLGRVKQIISAGMTQGRTAGDIRQQLRQGFGISERRARLIARDQTTKINGNLNMVRAVEAGINSYVWIGREDDLERPTHVANNNKIFDWDKPPAKTGHPGHDYQCRCYAKLIISI